MERMRLLLPAVLAAASLALGSAGTPAFGVGEAPDQTPARLNALYERAAVAGRRFDGAVNELARADEAVERERKASRRARIGLSEQVSAVAALTVELGPA